MVTNRMWWVWIVDAFVVVSFAVIGCDSHGFNSDWGEVVRISTPFVIALAVGVVGYSIWLRRMRPDITPLSVLTGIWMGVVTLAFGMVLPRFVFDDGTATTFVVITAAWIIGLMAGWRLAFSAVARLTAKG